MRGEIKKIFPLLLVVSFFSTLSFATPNEITQDSRSINISVKAELWTEDSQVSQNDLKNLASKWEAIANSYWNNQSFEHDGKRVHFNFSFTVRDGERVNKDRHEIEVRWGEPNELGAYNAFVQRTDNTLGPFEAVFPIQIIDATLGHEVGHLMNLLDEYDKYDNKNEIPKSIHANGLTLSLIDQEFFSGAGRWLVEYGPANEIPGLMSQHTNLIKNYYLDWIIGSITQGWDQ
jgi:hypothetical protein